MYIRVSFRGKDALSCSTQHTGHPPPLLCGKPECLCISMHVYGFMHAGCLTPARLRLFLNQSCHYRGRKIIWGQTNFFPAVSVCKCVYIYVWSHIYCMSTFKCVCVFALADRVNLRTQSVKPLSLGRPPIPSADGSQ